MYHANVNHAAEKGETPLHLACRNGNIECVKLLLEAGADRSANTSVSLNSFSVNISVEMYLIFVGLFFRLIASLLVRNSRHVYIVLVFLTGTLQDSMG